MNVHYCLGRLASELTAKAQCQEARARDGAIGRRLGHSGGDRGKREAGTWSAHIQREVTCVRKVISARRACWRRSVEIQIEDTGRGSLIWLVTGLSEEGTGRWR